MAEKTDHVLPRDGRAAFGGPRPPMPERPSKGPKEAETGTKEFGGYGDSRVTGHLDARRQFEGAAGTPSPRQLAARGDRSFWTHSEPSEQSELISKPVPLT
jgi:hypothetical protein